MAVTEAMLETEVYAVGDLEHVAVDGTDCAARPMRAHGDVIDIVTRAHR